MADDTKDTSATIVQLHPKKSRTAAERGRDFRARQRAARAATAPAPTIRPAKAKPAPAVRTAPNAKESVRERSPERPNARTPVRTAFGVPDVLTFAAFVLAAVGLGMNAWFARSLGSSDVSGWMFLAFGVAADLAAFVLPSRAAQLWQDGQGRRAVTAWSVWAVCFAFAIWAAFGFASINISDVTTARSERSSPAMLTAKANLADAMAGRDRECSHGVGKFCREREAAVADRRQALDVATRAIEQTADPQTEAAIKVVAWLSHGWLKPAADDVAMARLLLFVLLSQLGGLLLMVGRGSK